MTTRAAATSLDRRQHAKRKDQFRMLISHPVLRYGSDSPADAFRLLEAWRKVAMGLGQDELACALELQVAVGRHWADGDATLEAFRRARSPQFVSTRNRLFASWRSLVVEATLERESGKPEPPGSVWVHALVDAARTGADGASSFRQAVREWLDETVRVPATLAQSRGALGILTLDLDVGSSLRRTSPTLHRLLSTRWQGEPAVSASRRRWVERLATFRRKNDRVSSWFSSDGLREGVQERTGWGRSCRTAADRKMLTAARRLRYLNRDEE